MTSPQPFQPIGCTLFSKKLCIAPCPSIGTIECALITALITHTPYPSRRPLGELFLSQLDQNHPCHAFAYIDHLDASDAAYYLVYVDGGISLGPEPQFFSVHLVHVNGTPTLRGNHLVKILPVPYTSSGPKYFMSSIHQSILLAGCQEPDPCDLLRFLPHSSAFPWAP